MTRPIEEQRELCGKFMGWDRFGRLEDVPCYGKIFKQEGGKAIDYELIYDVSDYHPDTDVQQANDLKYRLRELGYTYKFYYIDDGHYIVIWDKNGNPAATQRKMTSEASALTAAVAELRASIESKK